MIPEIDKIWSDHNLVVQERKIWLAVMRAQRELSPYPDLVSTEDIAASQAVVHQVDLDSIRDRERRTRHDLKARLEEFVDLSGHSRIHLGMTSADVVENSYLIRLRQSTLALPMRHQLFCQQWLDSVTFRGIRGPVGSDQDQLDLLGGDQRKVELLNLMVAADFGFDSVAITPSQCVPRSVDSALASQLFDSLSDDPPEVRTIVKGVMTMLADAHFWLEGDVSTSCVRRYAWPLLFGAIDGCLFEKVRDG